MKRSPYILIVPLFVLMITACKKKDLPPDESSNGGSPVFYVRGEVSGFPINLQAGANNYYMTSSYYQDTTNVYVYKAEMKKKDCPSNCGYALTILINDSQVSAPSGSMSVSSGLKPGSYQFSTNNPATLAYTGVFTPDDPMSPDVMYTWDFGNGDLQHSYIATHAFVPGQTSKIKFSTSAVICGADLSNSFKVGNPLQANIQPVSKPDGGLGLSYKFVANTTVSGALQYEWDFGDNSDLSTEASPTHAYAKSGRYIAKVRLIDAQNDTCVSYCQVSAMPQKDCSANYTAVFNAIRDTKALGAVTVLVTDASGTVYSSRDYLQPSGSNFEIVSVEDYQSNDQGEPTKKVKIRFNCTVNHNGSQLTVKNGEAVIAVAYK